MGNFFSKKNNADYESIPQIVIHPPTMYRLNLPIPVFRNRVKPDDVESGFGNNTE